MPRTSSSHLRIIAAAPARGRRKVTPTILHCPVRDPQAFLGVLGYSLAVLRRGGLDPKAALNAHRILTAFTTGLVMNDLAS
jgi:hypothetical protein